MLLSQPGPCPTPNFPEPLTELRLGTQNAPSIPPLTCLHLRPSHFCPSHLRESVLQFLGSHLLSPLGLYSFNNPFCLLHLKLLHAVVFPGRASPIYGPPAGKWPGASPRSDPGSCCRPATFSSCVTWDQPARLSEAQFPPFTSLPKKGGGGLMAPPA